MMEDFSSAEKLLGDNEQTRQRQEWHDTEEIKSKRKQRGLIALMIVPGLVISLLLNVVSAISYLRPSKCNAPSFEKTQRYWSPVLEDLQSSYKVVKFDGTVFGSSLYREDASDEVDKAWMDLGLANSHRVEEADAERAGFSPGMVKFADSEGGGFVTQVEAFHNLHCLDTLRQGLFFNYDYYHSNRKGIWGRSDAIVRNHVGHCLDQLRLQLQCTADTSIVGMTWVNSSSGEPVPFPQFAREHKCRDFEAIRAWAYKHDHKGIVKWRPGDDLLSEFP